MNAMRTILTACLLGVPLLVGGCGGGASDSEEAVRQRLERFASALRDGDRAAFIECYAVDGQTDRRLIDATYDLARAMLELHRALASGQDGGGVALFQPSANRPGPPLPTEAGWAQAARLTIDAEAGTATAEAPGNDEPVRLVRRDGRWLLSIQTPGLAAGDRAWAERRAALFGRLAEAADAVRAQVGGAGGLSPEAAREALGERFALIVREAMARRR